MDTVMGSVNIISGQAVLLFLSLTFLIANIEIEMASSIFRVASRELSAYAISVFPLALLIYLLHFVSCRL